MGEGHVRRSGGHLDMMYSVRDSYVMANKMGTQDKVKARKLRANLLSCARTFHNSNDTGDKSDRYGPEMVRLVNELAVLENWESRS